MSLTLGMVADYLEQVPSLEAINNHDVKDEDGCKTGQMPLSIELGKLLIDDLLGVEDSEEDDLEEDDQEEDEQEEEDQEKKCVTLSQEERSALVGLREALDALPTSMSFQSIMSTLTSLDSIQKKLLDAINVYLDSIDEFEEHKLLLKSVVLVLKILEYDLSKKLGPVTVGVGFFKVQVLSDKQRIENHGTILNLLNDVIERFDKRYKEESTLRAA